MGLLGDILERRSSVTEIGTLARPTAWMSSLFGGGTSAAGVKITEANAENLSTVWCCVRSISEDVAKMPLKIYRRIDDGNREEVRDHPAWELLNRRANDDLMPAITVREWLIRRAMLWGNGLAEIERTNGGKPVALHPIVSTGWKLKRVQDGTLRYEFRRSSGSTIDLLPQDVFHLRGPSDDGYVGISILTRARESWGATMAAEIFAARFWANGARSSGVLQHPAKLTEQAMANLRKSFAEQNAGLDNAHRPMVLEQGMTWNASSVPPDDAQFLETRNFGVPEICRWFRFPPHKAGDLSRATFSNIEQQSKDYVDQCLSAWMQRTEQEADLKLLSGPEYRSHYAKHNASALLRGDLAARTASYATGRQWGWYSANDVRRMEDLNDLPDDEGDQYLAPGNMTTPTKLEAPVAPAPQPQPDPSLAPDPDPAAAKKKRDASIRAIVSSARPVIEDALGRVLRVEADKAARALKQGKLSDWRDTFYLDHALHVRRELMPGIEAIASSVGTMELVNLRSDWVALASSSIAERHVVRSRASICNDVIGRGDADKAIKDMATGYEMNPVGRCVRDASDALVTITEQLLDLSKDGHP